MPEYKFLATMLWVVMLPCAHAAEPGVSSDKLNIAIVLPLTASQAEFGAAYLKGAQACIGTVNRAGGVHGRKLVLQPYDDFNVAAESARQTKDILEQTSASEGVIAILGYVGVQAAKAVLPMLKTARTPAIGVASGSEFIGAEGAGWLFPVRSNDRDSMAALLRQLKVLNQKRLAVFTTRDEGGARNLALLKEGAAQAGMSLAASAEVDLNAFEAEGPGKQLAASKPDAIISFAGYAATAAMAKTALKNGFSGMFLAPSDVGARALARMLGADARGFGIVIPMPVPNDPTVRAVHDFRQSLTDSKLDVQPDEAALEGCLAARVVAEALRRAGGEPTREKLRRALLGNPFELGDYAIDYNEKGTSLSRGPSVVVLGPDGRPRR